MTGLAARPARVPRLARPEPTVFLPAVGTLPVPRPPRPRTLPGRSTPAPLIPGEPVTALVEDPSDPQFLARVLAGLRRL